VAKPTPTDPGESLPEVGCTCAVGKPGAKCTCVPLSVQRADRARQLSDRFDRVIPLVDEARAVLKGTPEADPGETRTGFWGPEDSVDLLRAAVERLRSGVVPAADVIQAVVTCLTQVAARVQSSGVVPWAEVGTLARRIVESAVGVRDAAREVVAPVDCCPRVQITVDWAGFRIEFDQGGGPESNPLAVYDMAVAGARHRLVAAVTLDDEEPPMPDPTRKETPWNPTSDPTTREAAADVMRLAIADPGAVTRRETVIAETMAAWRTRAALDALLAAGYSLAGPGDVVVRLPKVQDPDEWTLRWGPVQMDKDRAGVALRGIPDRLSEHPDDLRQAGCGLLAAADYIERGTRPAPPDTMPPFAGCTSNNPDTCACADDDPTCPVCEEPIEPGQEFYRAEAGLPWLPAYHVDQEYEATYWHAACDRRRVTPLEATPPPEPQRGGS
jgi:hypothetical protein